MIPSHLKMIQILLTVFTLDAQMSAQNIQKDNRNRFHSATKREEKRTFTSPKQILDYRKSIKTVAKDFKIQTILKRELRCFVFEGRSDKIACGIKRSRYFWPWSHTPFSLSHTEFLCSEEQCFPDCSTITSLSPLSGDTLHRGILCSDKR